MKVDALRLTEFTNPCDNKRPLYNGRPYIEEVLRRLQAVNMRTEIIVVEDASTDGTREWLLDRQKRQASGAREAEILGGTDTCDSTTSPSFFKRRNCGKGAALRGGLAKAAWAIVLVQGADIQYDLRGHPKLFEPILDCQADAV